MLLAAAVLGLLGMVPECLTRYFYFYRRFARLGMVAARA